MQKLFDLDQVLVGVGQMTGGECGLGPFERRGQCLGAFFSDSSLAVERPLAPLGASGLVRLVPSLLPLLEAMVQRINQMGIGQRRKLQPAQSRVKWRDGYFGQGVARGEFR